ncbi:unnamed protein product [Albugo candida]|uniref:Transcription and mRNA export factor ENY2 n=1 Tax=Albugo candida TaxID=65357 RepID=A0A024GS04_9STRA|nr:unnamed protein product [Albugo candida]|eukprot:CCI49341.1 unnamed protein product [Albugo candida]
MERNLAMESKEHPTSHNLCDTDLAPRLTRRFLTSNKRLQLKGLLKERLIEYGWIEGIKAQCKEMKDTFTGTTQMTANCSSLSVVASVPQSTVSELELKIRAFIDHNIENCEARSSSWTNM